MKNSAIEWCDHTFNPWEGCTKVSPGCAHCYAEARNARFGGGTAPNWGKGAPRRRTSVHNWNEPRRWDRESAKAKHEAEADHLNNGYNCDYRRPRVFCASLADWLDDEVPIEWLADFLDLVRLCSNLDFLLLTKRPQNWRDRIAAAKDFEFGRPGQQPGTKRGPSALHRWLWDWLNGQAPANVWLGTTVEDQQRANERMPALVEIPSCVKFLSVEPLLGPLDLSYWLSASIMPQVHWVIVGGESGPGARPLHPAWVRALRDECALAGVPFFFKQWGEWLTGEQTPQSGTAYARCDNGQLYAVTGSPERQNFGTNPDRHSGNLITLRIGKKAAGRLLDGVEHNEFPEA